MEPWIEGAPDPHPTPQTDEVLRAYPEYFHGVDDRKNGKTNRKDEFPVIGSGGRFEKKAYLLGYHEAVDCENERCIKKGNDLAVYKDVVSKVQYALQLSQEETMPPEEALRRIRIIVGQGF